MAHFVRMPLPPLIETFRRAGQSQVFAFFEQLDPAGQRQLLQEAAEIDLAEVDRLTRTLLTGSASAGVPFADLTPAPYEALPAQGGEAAAGARPWAARSR